MHKVSENPSKNRTISATPLMVVTALFVTLYLVSNIMAVKVISLFGTPMAYTVIRWMRKRVVGQELWVKND